MRHITTIILIIILTGIMTGITNFLLLIKKDDTKAERWINFLKSVFLSLCASATIPLFLQIISNNLLDHSAERPIPDKHYFILTGFCILAGIYSKRFLDDLYTRVNKIEQKAEEAKQQVENLENKNQEIDDVNQVVEEHILSNKKIGTEHGGEDIKAVVRAIESSRYTWRTATGISKETGFPVQKVNSILNTLYQAGFAESKAKNNKKLWKIDLT